MEPEIQKNSNEEIHNKEELKNKLQVILFSVGKKVDIEFLKKVLKEPEKEIKEAISELQKDLTEKKSPLTIIEENDTWKMNVKEKYSTLIQDLIPETELSKTVLETLAVIAWKQPILQSEVVAIRTNKAYDHIKELEETGYITKTPHGRSYLIRLTPKFFHYFDIAKKEQLQEIFKDFKEPERKKLIKEYEVEKPKVEVYNEEGPIITREYLGDLEVYDREEEVETTSQEKNRQSISEKFKSAIDELKSNVIEPEKKEISISEMPEKVETAISKIQSEKSEQLDLEMENEEIDKIKEEQLEKEEIAEKRLQENENIAQDILKEIAEMEKQSNIQPIKPEGIPEKERQLSEELEEFIEQEEEKSTKKEEKLKKYEEEEETENENE